MLCVLCNLMSLKGYFNCHLLCLLLPLAHNMQNLASSISLSGPHVFISLFSMSSDSISMNIVPFMSSLIMFLSDRNPICIAELGIVLHTNRQNFNGELFRNRFFALQSLINSVRARIFQYYIVIEDMALEHVNCESTIYEIFSRK